MDYVNSRLYRDIREIEESLHDGNLSPWVTKRAVDLLRLIGYATSDHVLHGLGATDPHTKANWSALGHDTDLLEHSLKGGSDD